MFEILARSYRSRLQSHLGRFAESAGSDVGGKFVELELAAPGGRTILSENIVEEFPRALILGGPGNGKTTLMLRAAAFVADRYLVDTANRPFPILIDARHLSGNLAADAIYANIAAMLQQELDEVVDATLLKTLMAAGRIHLMIDGLDEISIEQRDIAGAITDLFHRHATMPATVSSRPVGLTANLDGFAILTVLPLDEGRLTRLMRRWFPAGYGHLDHLLGAPQIKSILANPLMAHLVLSSAYQNVEFSFRPTFLADSIDRVIDNHIGKFEAIRLSRGEILSAFGVVAAFMHEKSITAFDYGSFRHVASTIIVEREATAHDLDTLLSLPILIETGPNEISFAHRSYHDYFVARHFRDDMDFFEKLIRRGEHREITRLAAGIVNDVAPLVETAMAVGYIADAVAFMDAAAAENHVLDRFVIQEIQRLLGQRFMRKLLDASGQQQARDPEEGFEIKGDGDPPTAMLIDLFQDANDRSRSHYEQGIRFERFCIELFNRNFKVVEHRAQAENGEVDLIVENTSGAQFWSDFGGEFVVECKNLSTRAPVEAANTLIGKVSPYRLKLALIVSMTGFTQPALDTMYLQSGNPMNALVVPITGSDLLEALRTRKDLEEFFKAQIRRVKYRLK